MALPAQHVEDAINSMLRTDYIPLGDTVKLSRLADYYVDYTGYLGQILGETDQLIVGRRGTGKTTLLYRAFVECMFSWDSSRRSLAKSRTLGIYIDLSKFQPLTEKEQLDFKNFEHLFVYHVCQSFTEEIVRSWPDVASLPNVLQRLFSSGESRRRQEVRSLVDQLATILQSGIPKIAQLAGPASASSRRKKMTAINVGGQAKPDFALSASAGISDDAEDEYKHEMNFDVYSGINLDDVLRVIGRIRETANVPSVLLFIDEFSSLPEQQQRRLSTLLKRMMGTHNGVFVKLCAIRDNYVLGSSIILQRDLFELSLDLDAFVERSSSLNNAMKSMTKFTRNIVTHRLRTYVDCDPEALFHDPEHAWKELSRSAMGVPRTLGIVLKNAWGRVRADERAKIERSDIEYGVRAASRSYLNQLIGASRDGVAIPRFVGDMWTDLLRHATEQRMSVGGEASHFMVLASNQDKLKWLSMFFLVHLLTDGRTTKKERYNRSLYCFDYGVCVENRLGFASDKNVIRQQRFAYDQILDRYERYFETKDEKRYICRRCKTIFQESDLVVAGRRLTFCPDDREELDEYAATEHRDFTEEEVKIIGAIRAARAEEAVLAREVADDVGCYVQKVAKFGGKLEKEGLIRTQLRSDKGRKIYFSS